MDYSVFYYTYSTIAQTLAGAFGFLVAATLYQMQQINARLERRMPPLAKMITYDQGLLLDSAAIGDWQDVSDRAKHFLATQEVEAPQRRLTEKLLAGFDRDLAKLRSIQGSLRWAIPPTGATIMLSFVFMPMTNRWLLSNPVAASVPLIVVILGALWSVGSYFPLVHDVTR